MTQTLRDYINYTVKCKTCQERLANAGDPEIIEYVKQNMPHPGDLWRVAVEKALKGN